MNNLTLNVFPSFVLGMNVILMFANFNLPHKWNFGIKIFLVVLQLVLSVIIGDLVLMLTGMGMMGLIFLRIFFEVDLGKKSERDSPGKDTQDK